MADEEKVTCKNPVCTAENVAAPHARAPARQSSLIAIVVTRSVAAISKRLSAFFSLRERRSSRLFLLPILGWVWRSDQFLERCVGLTRRMCKRDLPAGRPTFHEQR